jgi:hypothetical protein
MNNKNPRFDLLCDVLIKTAQIGLMNQYIQDYGLSMYQISESELKEFAKQFKAKFN